MAGLVVVDTDLLIDFLRGRGGGVAVVQDLLRARRLRLTAVTAFEMRLGTDFLARRGEILRLFRSRTVPLDLPSALRGGEVAATLRRRGQDIGMADCLQAGSACVTTFLSPPATAATSSGWLGCYSPTSATREVPLPLTVLQCSPRARSIGKRSHQEARACGRQAGRGS